MHKVSLVAKKNIQNVFVYKNEGALKKLLKHILWMDDIFVKNLIHIDTLSLLSSLLILVINNNHYFDTWRKFLLILPLSVENMKEFYGKYCSIRAKQCPIIYQMKVFFFLNVQEMCTETCQFIYRTHIIEKHFSC